MPILMKLKKEEKNLSIKMDPYSGNGDIASKDYEKMYNKPQIAGIELVGNKSFDDLGMERMTNTDIFDLIGGKING